MSRTLSDSINSIRKHKHTHTHTRTHKKHTHTHTLTHSHTRTSDMTRQVVSHGATISDETAYPEINPQMRTTRTNAQTHTYTHALAVRQEEVQPMDIAHSPLHDKSATNLSTQRLRAWKADTTRATWSFIRPAITSLFMFCICCSYWIQLYEEFNATTKQLPQTQTCTSYTRSSRLTDTHTHTLAIQYCLCHLPDVSNSSVHLQNSISDLHGNCTSDTSCCNNIHE